MVDASSPANRPADMVCPWCSAAITAETAICPSCGAILNADEEPDLPGVTAVDAAAAVRTAKSPAAKKTPASRNRIMSWISGDVDDAGLGGESQALAPPDLEVQREMLRLQLEAEVANLQAENDALLSEAAMEGRVIEIPESIKPLLTGEALTEVENAVAENAGEDGETPANSDGETSAADPDASETDAEAETTADGEGDAPAEGDDPA